MKTILISGYRTYDLGIFKDKDIRVQIIKAAIEKDLTQLLEEGVEWLIFTGNLGFEFWVLEVAQKLQSTYPLRLGTIFAFENQGESWNEANQAKLAQFKQVDFVKSAYPHYENPSQLKYYHQFLLDNTDGAYLFYDAENETKLKYLYESIRDKSDYELKTLTFDRLNEVAENFQ